jgi:hypothetical protein
MALLTYEPNGLIKVVGCAGVAVKNRYLSLFLVGDKAYLKHKARIGKIEFVVIKRMNQIFPNGNMYTAYPETNYVDTFNRVWLENELITQENALDFARIWWENIRQMGRRMFEEGDCYPIKPEGCH